MFLDPNQEVPYSRANVGVLLDVDPAMPRIRPEADRCQRM
jgi:hypothetical protein